MSASDKRLFYMNKRILSLPKLPTFVFASSELHHSSYKDMLSRRFVARHSDSSHDKWTSTDEKLMLEVCIFSLLMLASLFV